MWLKGNILDKMRNTRCEHYETLVTDQALTAKRDFPPSLQRNHLGSLARPQALRRSLYTIPTA